ncbi:molybdopterin-dependent oxidoreductase [Rubellimicrobium roseum]|uniref:Molybdopterin oxidoreductase n=1 Tax=Rubellimicrobium roseum TaxID=687525 RepID=A0A5C4N772_9RHOB|nr:molybdopterin-dependent oxidoreductase [Rubellimicrobium roseum]TNC61955.1 molybdopterin oxidoreductase [Rubellimicrobium roseum]
MPADPIRRRLLLAAPALLLSGCKVFDRLPRDGGLRDVLESANTLTDLTLGNLADGHLAPEYTRADIRQPMRPNGVTSPPDEDYLRHLASGWADWRLTVEGAVERPLALSLPELMARPSRTQITRHDCVEGWSCIAEWTGVPLSRLLSEAGLRPEARFVVFRCMDTIERGLSGNVLYWESLALRDALHPQTILAYGINGGALPVPNGAPLRLRVERQLGYKMPKYLRGIEVVADLPGQGGYWEERGYDWYAGI